MAYIVSIQSYCGLLAWTTYLFGQVAKCDIGNVPEDLGPAAFWVGKLLRVLVPCLVPCAITLVAYRSKLHSEISSDWSIFICLSFRHPRLLRDVPSRRLCPSYPTVPHPSAVRIATLDVHLKGGTPNLKMSSESSVTKHQPAAIDAPSPRSRFDVRYHTHVVQRKLTTRKGWFGDYDYAWLCSPALPFSIGGKNPNRRKQPPFYGLDDELPLVLAIASGLQHALAMLAGLITPPIIFASTLALNAQTSAYLISASLIGCGELSTEHLLT